MDDVTYAQRALRVAAKAHAGTPLGDALAAAYTDVRLARIAVEWDGWLEEFESA